MKKKVIYTIGHSTRPIHEFIVILQTYDIEQLIDVRTIPKSKFAPQFGQEKLRSSLEHAHISYHHEKHLGGLRHTTKDSINTGWRNASFRGYADYMQTDEFEIALKKLEDQAGKKVTAIMCAEAVPWRCHRSLIADALLVDGWEVIEILSATNAREHKLTDFAKVKNHRVYYPGE